MGAPKAVCPICRGAAKQAARTTGDFEEFSCKFCGQFRVSGTLYQSLRKRSAAEKQRALFNAKLRQRAGQALMITTYDLPSYSV